MSLPCTFLYGRGGIKLRKTWSMPYLQGVFCLFFLLRLRYFSAFGSFLPQNFDLKRQVQDPGVPGQADTPVLFGESPEQVPGV